MSTPQQPEPHVTAAIETEQQLLAEHMQRAQAEYLLNRCITLAAEINRRDAAAAQKETRDAGSDR